MNIKFIAFLSVEGRSDFEHFAHQIKKSTE